MLYRRSPGVPCQSPTFGYGLPVKLRRARGFGLVVLFLISGLRLAADVIHLRNERIETADRTGDAAIQKQFNALTAPGLFLVQFNGVARPEWREALKRA